MPAFAGEVVAPWFRGRGGRRVEWCATFSTEALARGGYSATFRTTVFEWRAAILTEFLSGGVVTPAIRTAHRLTK